MDSAPARWTARLLWLAVGCALAALVAAAVARAVLQRFPAEVSAQLNAAVAQYIPDAEVEFARAELRLSLRGLLHAHVRDLRLRRGRAGVRAPRADFWVEKNGIVARLHSPTIRLAPAKSGGVFPAVALGGFQVVAIHDAVVSAPLPLWGGVTLRAVNLTAAHRPNGDIFIQMQNNEPGRKFSLEADARQNFTFSARGRVEGFPPPDDFPLRWGADAGANLWAEVDLKKQQWRIALDAQGGGASWRDLGVAKNISVRAVISKTENSRRIVAAARGENIRADGAGGGGGVGGSGGAANVSIAADIFESGRARRAVVIADGAGAALDGVGGARILSARIHTSQDGDDFRATIFAGGEELRLERLTHTVFANLAGAEKYLSHAEWEKFFANAEYSNSRDGRRAAVFAEGEGLSGIFGEVVSLQLRANAKTKADDWESRIALALRDVFSPYAGSALAVNATAALSQTESGTLRATFAMALDESEFLFMPVEAPSFRALRTRGEFSGGPDGEWNLHLPETRIELGAAESENTTAPVVSSFPIRVGAAGAQGGEKVSAFPFSHSSSRTTPTGPTQFESGRAKTVPTESESIIQASLFAFGGEDAARGWRVSAGGRNLRMAEAWRYLPDRAALRDLREWLRESVPAGIISRGRLAVSGAEVSLSGVFDRGRIVIGDGWPDAENLSGAFSFADGQVAIDGEGVFDGLPIADVAARAPNVFADAVTLFLDIHPAPQPLPRYLQTALDLPEAMDYRAGVESYDLRGRGMLSIAAVIPLAKGAPNSFAANLQVEDGVFSDLQNPAVPPLESVSGAVALTDDASSGAFTGAMRGLPAALNFAGDGDFDLRAKMDSQEAMKIAEVDLPLRGTLAFELSRRGEMTLFTSDLRGVEFLLPAPFDKNSESPAPVFARVLGETTRLSLQVNGNEVRALLRGDENGAVGLNADPGELPESGFRLVGGASGADVDGWLALAFGGDGDSDLGGELILTLTNAKALGKTVSALTATVRAPRGKPLQGWVGAPDLRGKFSVDFQAGGGAAELAYVNLSSGPNDADAERGGGGMEMFFAPRDFALTATITELRRDGELLGGGAGVIRGSPDSWRLADGVLILGENRMMASAEYIAGPSPRTSVSLRLVASDLPGVTRGLGLGDFVQRGALTVSGKLNWKLPPTALGFAGMAGRLRLDASDIRYQAEGGGGRSRAW